MPVVELDIARVDVTVAELATRSEDLYERWMAGEYGLGPDEGFDSTRSRSRSPPRGARSADRARGRR